MQKTETAIVYWGYIGDISSHPDGIGVEDMRTELRYGGPEGCWMFLQVLQDSNERSESHM